MIQAVTHLVNMYEDFRPSAGLSLWLTRHCYHCIMLQKGIQALAPLIVLRIGNRMHSIE